MAELIDPFVALVEVDGSTVRVPLFVAGNEEYQRAVAQALEAGKPAREPTGDELARAVETWRQERGRLDGFSTPRHPVEGRTLFPDRGKW